MGNEKDDRPPKSWREIDKAKDRSSHRKEDKPKTSPRAQERSVAAQKQYRAALDKLFDGGRDAVGTGWKKLLPDLPAANAGSDPADDAGAARQAGLRAIRASQDRRSIEKAVDAFRATFELPDDPDLLVTVLQDGRDAVLREALERLDRLMPLHTPSSALLASTRLRRIEEDPDRDHDVRALASQVRKKL